MIERLTRVTAIEQTSHDGVYRFTFDDGATFDLFDQSGMTWVNRSYYIGKEVMVKDRELIFCN